MFTRSTAGFDNTGSVDENAAKGTLVGAPIVATTDANAGDVLYYTDTVPPSDSNPFAIDKKTGQITVAGTVHFERTRMETDLTYNVTVPANDPSGTGTDTQEVKSRSRRKT